MASRVSPDLKALLDEKFSAHEHRSNLAISELEGRLRELMHDQEKAQDKRHMETLSLLQTHSSELTAHDVRIKRVEEHAAKGELKRDESFAAWRGLALAIVGALAVSAITSIVTLLKH